MYRGLILGALAFAAVYAAERQFHAVKSDVDRYDRLRAMSGESSLLKQFLSMGLNAVSGFTQTKEGQLSDAFQMLTRDLVRYAQLRSM